MSTLFGRGFHFSLYLGIILFCFLTGKLWAQSSPIVFNTNAGWCWYQDERAIITNNKLIIGSVGDTSGTDGATRNGDVEVTTYDLSTLSINRFTLKDYIESGDDHDSPAFLVRPDGKILAVYCRHGGDSLVRYRITSSAGDTSSWSTEQTFNVSSNYGATYENLYRLSSTGITYDFYRGQDYNPNVLTSTDNGSSWSKAGRLIRTAAGTRPYAKYASNNTDKVWFTYTDGHPRDVVTNLYAAYLQGSNIYDSYGVDIGDLNTSDTSGIAPSAGTKIFYADSTHRAWTSDMELDTNGNPVAVYSVRIGTVDIYNDHRYRYARFDGSTWHDYEIAYAGQCLYSAENDYTGLVTLNPSDLNTVYISTNADPVMGSALISSADGKRHWEVFRGFTNDNGATWTWTPVTANSTTDNLRPILPVWDTQHTALLWLKGGTYTSYTNYDQDAVGYVFDGANGIWSNTSGGDWTSSGNWQSGIIAGGKLGIADFSTLDISGTATVQLNGSRTLGFMVFKDTNTSSSGNWAINTGSGGTITLENLGPARPMITVQNQTAAINVSLGGTQGVDVKGSGTLIFGASNTYSGGTNIYTGATLQVGDGGALPTAGAVTNNSALIFNSSGTVTLNGVISGTGTLTQNGSGTVILGGANYYTGPTVLNAGALRMAHAYALGTATTDVIIPGGAGSARLELVNNISVARNIVLNGRGASPGANLAPHLVNAADNNTLTSNISLAESGYDYVIQSDAGKLTLAGNIINNTGNAIERELYLQGAGDGEFSGTIGNGTGSGSINLLKDGTGTWTLTQDLVNLGDITVMEGVLDMTNILLTDGSVEIQSGGAELIVDSLYTSYLSIGSGSMLVIGSSGLSESLEITPVPEPSSALLLIMGGLLYYPICFLWKKK